MVSLRLLTAHLWRLSILISNVISWRFEAILVYSRKKINQFWSFVIAQKPTNKCPVRRRKSFQKSTFKVPEDLEVESRPPLQRCHLLPHASLGTLSWCQRIFSNWHCGYRRSGVKNILLSAQCSEILVGTGNTSSSYNGTKLPVLGRSDRRPTWVTVLLDLFGSSPLDITV